MLIKMSSKITTIFAMLLLAGCSTTTYKPTAAETANWTPEHARKYLVFAGNTGFFAALGCNGGTNNVRVSYDKMVASCTQLPGREYTYRFADYPSLTATLKTDVYDKYKDACITIGNQNHCTVSYHGVEAFELAQNFVKAWSVVANTPLIEPKQETSFELSATSYLGAKVKPELPEEAVKFKIQAEAAVQQKRFDDALDLFQRALDIAPWWPEGHYNRGLLLAERLDNRRAALELKRYLKLVPDAANARAVQNKIYALEDPSAR